MERFFDIVPEVPASSRFWRDVSLLGWKLGPKGKWPPVSDLAVATAVLMANAVVVSPDAHFRDVPGLKVVKLL